MSVSALFPRRSQDGLPATGATLVLAAGCFLGAVLDTAVAGHLGICFGTAYVAGCAVLGARVRRSELVAVLVAPPLVFAAVAFLAVQLLATGSSLASVLASEALSFGGALGTGAPVLFAGLAAAALLALVRLSRHRPIDRPTAPDRVASAPAALSLQPAGRP